MNPRPERLVPRAITVYDREWQCTAPGCGKWFTPHPKATRQRWCSKLCKLRAYRAGMSFHKERKPTD